MTDDKIRENRLRRMAARQGLQLCKTRRRDPQAIDYDCYALADQASSGIVFGVGALGRYSASLDEIEDYLQGEHAEISTES
jgi:hypothetical protein